MTKEEILNRIEQIISISKEKANVPPVNLVLAIDGNLITEELYGEYEDLLKIKIENKYYTKKEKSKLEQLSYIKDKLTFLEKKAKNSKNSISILPDDISEYSDAFNLYNELSSELKTILNPPFVKTSSDSNIEKKNIDIESTISLPSSKKVSISLEDSDFEQNNNIRKNNKDNNKNSSKNNLFQVLDIPSSKQNNIKKDNTTNINTSNNILNDLADIDKILNNITLSSTTPLPDNHDTHSKFYIGSVVTPILDVTSYNDSSITAIKDSIYRIVSFVALDKDDNVISSSNILGTSFRDFSDDNPQASLNFILAKTDDSDIDSKEWANRSISIDLPNCIGSFSSFSSFKSLATPSSV